MALVTDYDTNEVPMHVEIFLLGFSLQKFASSRLVGMGNDRLSEPWGNEKGCPGAVVIFGREIRVARWLDGAFLLADRMVFADCDG